MESEIVAGAIGAGVVFALWASVEYDRLRRRDEPIDRPWPQQWRTLWEHDKAEADDHA